MDGSPIAVTEPYPPKRVPTLDIELEIATTAHHLTARLLRHGNITRLSSTVAPADTEDPDSTRIWTPCLLEPIELKKSIDPCDTLLTQILEANHHHRTGFVQAYQRTSDAPAARYTVIAYSLRELAPANAARTRLAVQCWLMVPALFDHVGNLILALLDDYPAAGATIEYRAIFNSTPPYEVSDELRKKYQEFVTWLGSRGGREADIMPKVWMYASQAHEAMMTAHGQAELTERDKAIAKLAKWDQKDVDDVIGHSKSKKPIRSIESITGIGYKTIVRIRRAARDAGLLTLPKRKKGLS